MGLPIWRGHDLQKYCAIKPSLIRSWDTLAEMFAIYVETYIDPAAEPQDIHPFLHLKTEMQLDASDGSLLFPTRRGAPTSEDIMYGLAVLLHWIAGFGYELFLLKDRIEVNGPNHTIGVRRGRTLCHYDNLCIPVPTTDWEALLTQPRDATGAIPAELYYLYIRANNKLNPDHELLKQAVSVLTWAGSKHRPGVVANFYFGGTENSIRSVLEQRVLASAEPIKDLRKLLVPKFLGSAVFSKILKPFAYQVAIWDRKELENFINLVLAHTDIDFAFKNNKRIKSHVSSNHRQGRSR